MSGDADGRKSGNLALVRHSVQSQGLQSKVMNFMKVVDDYFPIHGTICLMTRDKKLPSSVIPVYAIMLEVLHDVFCRFMGHNI